MDQPPTIAINGYNKEETELEFPESATEFQNDAQNCSAGGGNPPVLFHKVKNQKSILALIVSDSKIYAGTQGGEIIVSDTHMMCSCDQLLRRFSLGLVVGDVRATIQCHST